MSSGRAQSETLGFVLVFGLMVASIGLVYTAGFSGLQDVQDSERINNAERAFEVFANNVEDITLRGAPSRATEIKLADAELSVGDPVEIEVNHTAAGFNETYTVRPIVFDAGTGSTIVYEQGAVLRTNDDDAVVRHKSSFLLNESRSVIPVLKTRQSGRASVAGSTTVLVRTDHSGTSLVYANDTVDDVWVNVSSPRADAWRRHLDVRPNVECEPVTNDTASCSVTTNEVTVTLVRINVALE